MFSRNVWKGSNPWPYILFTTESLTLETTLLHSEIKGNGGRGFHKLIKGLKAFAKFEEKRSNNVITVDLSQKTVIIWIPFWKSPQKRPMGVRIGGLFPLPGLGAAKVAIAIPTYAHFSKGIHI